MANSGVVPLVGNELTLVAQVGSANNSTGQPRWKQVHFNRAVAEEFFRLTPGDSRSMTFERVSKAGKYAGRDSHRMVYSEVNKNPKVEFDFSPAKPEDYPKDLNTRPLLVITEIDLRTFRYRAFMPGWPGYQEVLDLNLSLPHMGRPGMRRGVTTLDEVELRWPSIGLRNPSLT